MNASFSDDKAWDGAHVTVMGLGLFGGGAGAARFAADRGAIVTVTDMRSADDLAESLPALDDIPIRYVLGRHDETDFASADVVIVNPAVPMSSPFLRIAADAGASLTSEMLLFVERFGGRVVGVSGSNGKTTTASLLGDILKRHDPRAALGGNLGVSLLPNVDTMDRDATAVLEISSFQLEWLGRAGWSPSIGVLTNLSPNHLDRHGTYEAYVAAKRELLAHQTTGETAVLNGGDPGLVDMSGGLAGRVLWFGAEQRRGPGARVEDGRIVVEVGGCASAIMDVADVPLPGAHNLENVLAAAAAASAAGVPNETIADAVRAFRAVEHRLEFVREVAGVRYFNDSIATTPESAICALRSFEPGALIVIAGGYDKKVSFDSLGEEIARCAGRLIVLGDTADAISAAAATHGFPSERSHRVGAISEAVELAASLAEAGQAVALSPACASYDQYRNFAERGREFKELVTHLPDGG